MRRTSWPTAVWGMTTPVTKIFLSFLSTTAKSELDWFLGLELCSLLALYVRYLETIWPSLEIARLNANKTSTCFWSQALPSSVSWSSVPLWLHPHWLGWLCLLLPPFLTSFSLHRILFSVYVLIYSHITFLYICYFFIELLRMCLYL
jgi:hypothetical protein